MDAFDSSNRKSRLVRARRSESLWGSPAYGFALTAAWLTLNGKVSVEMTCTGMP